MKIISIHIYSLYEKNPIILDCTYDLSFVSIFQRGALKEFINFNSRLVISRASPGQHLEVALEKGVCYAILNSDKIGVTMICDEEYPKRVAIDLLLKIQDSFQTFLYQKKVNVGSLIKDTSLGFTYIEGIIKDWQNPKEKDSLMKLQNELTDVQDIMKKNLNELLKREENLDALMAKSKDLSASSLNFYKQAKKTNSCCNF